MLFNPNHKQQSRQAGTLYSKSDTGCPQFLCLLPIRHSPDFYLTGNVLKIAAGSSGLQECSSILSDDVDEVLYVHLWYLLS